MPPTPFVYALLRIPVGHSAQFFAAEPVMSGAQRSGDGSG